MSKLCHVNYEDTKSNEVDAIDKLIKEYQCRKCLKIQSQKLYLQK